MSRTTKRADHWVECSGAGRGALAAFTVLTLAWPAWAQQDSNTATKLLGAFYWKESRAYAFVYELDEDVDEGCCGPNGETLPGHKTQTAYVSVDYPTEPGCIYRLDGDYETYDERCTFRLGALRALTQTVYNNGVEAISNNLRKRFEILEVTTPCPLEELEDEKFRYKQGKVNAVFSIDTGGMGRVNSCYEGKGRTLIAVAAVTGGCCGSFWSADSVHVVDLGEYDAAHQNNLGFKAYKKKDYETAIQHFKAAIALEPKSNHPNFNLACTLSILKRPYDQIYPPLNTLLEQPELKAAYCNKVVSDSDLTHFRAQPSYSKWHQRWCGK